MINFWEPHPRPNILILGNSGSGKTSLVNCILASHREKSVIFSQNPNGNLKICNGITKCYSSTAISNVKELQNITETAKTVVFDNIETIQKNQAWIIKHCLDHPDKSVILTTNTAWQQPYEEKFFHDLSCEKKMNVLNYLIVGKISVNTVCSSIFQNYQDIYSATRFTFSQKYRSFLYYENSTLLGQLDIEVGDKVKQLKFTPFEQSRSHV
jgi:energy-coupling factor transporter ATP-binding protein EcfA2